MLPIGEKEIKEVVKTLRSGWIGTGEKVDEFERNFAKYKGVDDALAVNSGTSALHLVFDHLGIGEGDDVIVPAMTFSASAHAALYTGANVILVDCEEDGLISYEDVKKKITPNTKAIVIVHYTGKPANVEQFREFEVPLIEDCAHTVEYVGTTGDYGCFSFYATKPLTTGDGGMIIGKDLNPMRIKANQGQLGKTIVTLGYKYRMNDIQAAMGIYQLKDIEKNRKKRKEVWEKYNEAFGYPKTKNHGMHLYTVLTDYRDEMIIYLKTKGISAGIHYKSLHLHPYYYDEKRVKFHRDNSEDLFNSEFISDKTITLPLDNPVIYEVKQFLSNYNTELR